MSDFADDAVHFISLGAGRQSTAICLLAAHGLIEPMPGFAVFADTGNEPSWVYETVRWLQSANVSLPFPVYTTERGSLADDLLAGDDMARCPFHIKNGSMVGKQCTRNYKIRPVRQEARRAVGLGPRSGTRPGMLVQWIGISRDEADRMKPSGVQFMVNRWPLIEMMWSVADCEAWMRKEGYPIPWSSACGHCPLISDAQRRRIRDHDPETWKRACQIDDELRTPENIARFRGEVYVHPSRTPLRSVDLDSGQYDLFSNECEGVCGV